MRSNCTLHNRIFGFQGPQSMVPTWTLRNLGWWATTRSPTHRGLGQSFGTSFASSAFNSASVISSSSSAEAFAAFSAEDFASPSASAAMDATSVPPSFFTSSAAVSFSFSFFSLASLSEGGGPLRICSWICSCHLCLIATRCSSRRVRSLLRNGSESLRGLPSAARITNQSRLLNFSSLPKPMCSSHGRYPSALNQLLSMDE
mmetsp:Transcript_14589/g.61602  ORF Transcript_14589/g.61602 Transcript_14589/m.61602 type:complete len:202 (+) Transcript_14589:6120-6725(+)